MFTISSITEKSYAASPIIFPPKSLPPIFVSRHHSNLSLRGLALTHSALPLQYREGCQVFEVPTIGDDCQTYCGRGYSDSLDMVPTDWKPEGWIQLADKTDFTCRRFFSKVFVYKHHYGRQWGDGTILEKFGYVRHGATPVYRFTDPNHPLIVACYGPVQSVWIQKTKEEVPAPVYRFESTHTHGFCADCDHSMTLEEVSCFSKTPYEDTYAKLIQERDQLLAMETKEEKLA